MPANKEKKEAMRRERMIRARALYESGYSVEEISTVLGVSEATVRAILKLGKEKEND